MTQRYNTFVTNFLNSINSSPYLNTSRNSSIYAYEQIDLIRKLKRGRFQTARDFLEKEDESFQRELRKFRSTSAAAPFNPHKTQEDSPYFVKAQTIDGFNFIDDLDVLIPFPDGTIRFSHVVHVGPKGSGKTTLQNQWLHSNHNVLENANVFYIRCDAPKIFEFWRYSENLTQSQNLPTIEEYLDFQLLYVLAKNRHVGLPRKIFNRLKDENVVFNFKEARAIDAPDRSSKLIVWYLVEHIAKSIDNFERGDSNLSYVINSLFPDRPTKQREYTRWKECAKSVKEWLQKENFILLRILDGVDNLHLNTESGKKVYDLFIPEVKKFILRSAPENEIRFAVMRNRTWIDVQKNDPTTLGSGAVIAPDKVILHVPPNSDDIINKRVDWLRSKHGAEECARIVESTITALPSGDILHQNMRTVIEAAASLSEQVKFRCYQIGRDIDIHNQSKVQMKRNLFLNGRFFLQTQIEFDGMNREKGLPYLNPFWFNDELVLRNGFRDPLFLRIRILELLYTGDLLEDDLQKFLIDGFSYDKKSVGIAIDDARAFGWIDSKSESTGNSDIILELSHTGKYLLCDLLSDVDVLYMLALDTRLPKYFFDNDLIQVHTNHIHERTGYIGAATVTVFNFVVWLAQQTKTEIESIDLNYFNGSYSKVFLSNIALTEIQAKFAQMLRHAEQEDWDLIESKCYQYIS